MVFISELPVPDARIFFCSARIPTGPSFNFWTIFYVEGSSSPIAGRDDELTPTIRGNSPMEHPIGPKIFRLPTT